MVTIAYAPPQDRAEVVQFMMDVFPRVKWGSDGWHRLLGGRWSGPEGHYAITARDKGALIGVLGQNAVLRVTPLGLRKYVNLTSWYVLKSHRGQGLGGRLMTFALDHKDTAVTNITSARAALPLVDRVGFEVLDDTRLIWQARDIGSRKLTVHADPLATELLTAQDRRVLQDHRGLNLKTVIVETPDGPCTLALSVKQKHDDYMTHEVTYMGARNRFAAHGRAIADALLPASDAVLSVDSRLLPETAQPDVREPIPVPRFYTPGQMRAQDIDHMYTEVVLMDMKLY